MLIVRSLVAAIFLCLLAVAPAAASAPCTSLTPTPTPERSNDPPVDELSCADLDGANLTDLPLAQADMSGASLVGADLAKAHLVQTDLSDVNLRDATLTGANLIQADLIGADLRGADLAGANLGQADLTGADLRNANLTDADLSQADLHGVDLRGATLTGASAVQAFGLAEVRVDPVGPGGYIQLGYLLLGPATVLLLVWWRSRISYLVRHRAITPVRSADVVAVGVGVGLAVTGLYLLCTGAIRGFASAVGGWLWTVDPGPIPTRPLTQLGIGAVTLVVSAFLLQVPRRRRPTRDAPVDFGQVAIGKPTLGRLFPVVGPRLRGVLALAGILGLLDVLGVLVLWILDLLPARGPWSADQAFGHLVVVGVTALFLIRAVQPMADPSASAATLTGVVFVAGTRAPYLWLSGASASRQPANRALPLESLEHVHLIRTLGSKSPGTAMVTIRPPGGGEPVEYPNELPVPKAEADRLRALLGQEKVSEVVRAPED